MRTVALFALAVFATGPAPIAAQSLYNAAGLGSSVESVDGRARALGNLGIGMWGGGLSPNDPGAAAHLFAPTAVIVGQPSWVDYERGAGETGSLQGTRFPLIGIAYPLYKGMATVTMGSMLDQRFQGSRDVAFDLLDEASGARDNFSQEGAVSDVRVGYGQTFGQLGVGFSIGRYAGSVKRTLTRDFDLAGTAGSLQDFEVTGRWRYSGNSFTGGFAADVRDFLRVAGSVTVPGKLDAVVEENFAGADRSFSMPTQLRVGASAVLSEGLLVTASVVRADWSEVAADLTSAGTVGGTGGFGMGVELSRFRLLGIQAPLRFGYRKSDIPFAYGPTAGSESVWAGGLGLGLSEQNGIQLASADFSLERGNRSDSVLTESFWRGTISLRISGF